VNSTLGIYGFEEGSKAFIYNLNGKLVISIDEPQNQINISDLPNGVYFLKIEGKLKVFTKKFVKQ